MNSQFLQGRLTSSKAQKNFLGNFQIIHRIIFNSYIWSSVTFQYLWFKPILIHQEYIPALMSNFDWFFLWFLKPEKTVSIEYALKQLVHTQWQFLLSTTSITRSTACPRATLRTGTLAFWRPVKERKIYQIQVAFLSFSIAHSEQHLKSTSDPRFDDL